MIKDSGQRTEYSTGAVRDMKGAVGRFDLLPWKAIWEVAKHCEEGAKKYGEHNVDKGIPIHSFIDSAFRHLAKYTMGMDDENHLRAAAWNIIWAIQTEIDHPELQDIPVWMGKGKQHTNTLDDKENGMFLPPHKTLEVSEMTAGDKIRSLNNAELAEFICSQGWLLGDTEECEKWLNSFGTEFLDEKD